MRPVSFPQVNGTLLGGPAADFGTENEVSDLRVCRTGDEIISAWKAESWGERLRIFWSGRVWLRVCAKNTHAPVELTGMGVFE